MAKFWSMARVGRPPSTYVPFKKWEVPKTTTALRAFLGFANFTKNLHTCMPKWRHYCKIKESREEGKKWSKNWVEVGEVEHKVFEELGKRFYCGLIPQRLDTENALL